MTTRRLDGRRGGQSSTVPVLLSANARLREGRPSRSCRLVLRGEVDWLPGPRRRRRRESGEGPQPGRSAGCGVAARVRRPGRRSRRPQCDPRQGAGRLLGWPPGLLRPRPTAWRTPAATRWASVRVPVTLVAFDLLHHACDDLCARTTVATGRCCSRRRLCEAAGGTAAPRSRTDLVSARCVDRQGRHLGVLSPVGQLGPRRLQGRERQVPTYTWNTTMSPRSATAGCSPKFVESLVADNVSIGRPQPVAMVFARREVGDWSYISGW